MVVPPMTTLIPPLVFSGRRVIRSSESVPPTNRDPPWSSAATTVTVSVVAVLVPSSLSVAVTEMV